MKKKKVLGISVITVLVVAVLVASYVLIVIPRKNEAVVSEETANVETGEKVQAGEVSTEGWDLSKVNIVYDTEGVPVPVPKGYVASSVEGEHTVNDGFVIYEGEEEVTGVSTDSSVLEAQKTRNQWVWVPIYDPSEIYGIDENGMMHGKLYNYTADGRTARKWTESNGVMKVEKTPHINTEPVIKDPDNDSTLDSYFFDKEEKEFYIELNEEFKLTIESIIKYGGFYIGRYEIGGNDEDAKIVKAYRNRSGQNWYTMYKKSEKLSGTNKNIETSMIWGCMWDATLEWLVDSGNKTYSEVGNDSTSWGEFVSSPHSDSYYSGTGAKENYKANNIYDMAGKFGEWTLEGSTNSYRVYRSIGMKETGINSKNSAEKRREYYPYSDERSGFYITSRAILYIKS